MIKATSVTHWDITFFVHKEIASGAKAVIPLVICHTQHYDALWCDTTTVNAQATTESRRDEKTAASITNQGR
jgi:hypothetical protein